MTVKLTYFKSSGKYYAVGEYETEKDHMFQIFDEVETLKTTGRLPGLCEGAKEFHVLVECPDHPQGYPGLIPL